MSSIFKDLPILPPDPLLGLSVEFNDDTRPGKIDLSVGVYRDEELKVPIMEAVKQAEKRILERQKTKSYQPIDGGIAFLEETKEFVFGKSKEAMLSTQALGGTGALFLSGKLLKEAGKKVLYIPDPTWPNHMNIFPECGLTVKSYPYKKGMVEALEKADQGSIILLHGCCHNPTGVDPTKEEWEEISTIMKKRQLTPLFDLAYQGFAKGVEEDAWAVRFFAQEGHEVCVASSYSKNFGLYGERAGAVFVVTKEQKALGVLKKIIRSTYSNPPIHSAAIVTEILKCKELKALWLAELNAMRTRIQELRQQFSLAFQNDELQNQQGLFTYLDLSPAQVAALKEKYAIYLAGKGRVNVSGLSKANIPVVVRALEAVL